MLIDLLRHGKPVGGRADAHPGRGRSSRPEARLRRVLAGLLLVSATQQALAVESIDILGDDIQLARPAQRIISLAPHITELLFAAGVGARIVGADVWSDYPPAARGIARIGDSSRIDLERVLALKPDLVVAWDSGNPRADIAQLRRLGVPVFISEPRHLQDIADDLRKLGHLTGADASAETAARDFEVRLDALRARYAEQRPLRVFYQISAQPLMTVNGAHLISALLALCGGRNIFADLVPLAPAVSTEAVLGADPDVIIAGTWQGEPDNAFDTWKRWPQMSAVRHGRLYTVPADDLHRATPRLLDGAQKVCTLLQQAR
jgi:iron complex transport system substrate-binding protein